MWSAWVLPIAIDLCAVIPVWLLGQRRRSGWAVMFVQLAVLWPLYAASVGGWGWFPGIVVQASLAARGWWLWGDKDS